MSSREELIKFWSATDQAANAALQAYTLTGRADAHPATYETIALDCFKRAADALGYDLVKREPKQEAA
jgi:hypothetical protein